MSKEAAPLPVSVESNTNSTIAAEAVAHIYEFTIAMSCGGCSGAINNKLGKMSGILSYSVSLETQKAIIHTTAAVTPEIIYRALHATGKTIQAVIMDGEGVDLDALRKKLGITN